MGEAVRVATGQAQLVSSPVSCLELSPSCLLLFSASLAPEGGYIFEVFLGILALPNARGKLSDHEQIAFI